MRLILLPWTVAFALAGCVVADRDDTPVDETAQVTQPARVECNEATVGLACDTDDSACTVEQCQIVGPGVACVATGLAPDSTPCGSDGDPCSLDACWVGVCTHDALPTGSLCLDGDSCTVGERCNPQGVCTDGALVCEPPDGGVGDDAATSAPDGGTTGDGGVIDGDGGAPDAALVPDGGAPDAGLDDADAAVDEVDAGEDIDGTGVLPGFPGEVGGGGLGCAAGGDQAGGGAGVLLLLALLAVRVRRRRVALAAGLLLALGFAPAPAQAQDLDVSVFRPASPGSGGFAADDATVLGRGEVDVGLWLDVARDLLVVRDPDSGEVMDGGRLLASRTTMHLAATFGLPAGLQLGVALPVIAAQQGDALPGGAAPAGGELGDLAVTATWRAGGSRRVGVAIAVDTAVPLGSGGYAHAAGPAVGARVIVGGRAGRVAWSLAAGRQWREPQMLGDLTVDDAWLATAGGRLEVLDRRMWLVADAHAQRAAGGDGQGDPAEALAGVRARITGPWVAQVGAGIGLTHGYGAPGVRGLALLAWALDRAPPPSVRELARVVVAPPPPAPPVRAPAPRDHDLLIDQQAVSCVETGCAAPDPTPPELVIERIVLDDRILFDTDRARVKRRGRRILAETVARWAASPSWDRIVLEGHADDRGDDAWNDELGRLRAERVRAALIEQGADPDRVTVVSYGKRRPRVEGHSERARATNRRVEMVVLRARP